MPDESTTFVLLKIRNGNVEAFHAKVGPTVDENIVLNFKGPINVSYPKKEYQIFNEKAAQPFYNTSLVEIVWATQGNPSPDDKRTDNTVNVFRIGPHFQVQSVDHSPFQIQNSTRPSVALVDSLNCVGVQLHGSISMAHRNEGAQGRGDSNESPWINLPFRTMSTEATDSTETSTLFTNEKSKYIYNVTSTFDNPARVFLHTIRANQFKDLARDKSLIWQEYEIDLGPDAHFTGAHMITNDRLSGKRRLYLFARKIWTSSPHPTFFGYIELDKDGAVDSHERVIKAKGLSKLLSGEILTATRNVPDMNCHKFGDQFLVIWKQPREKFYGARIAKAASDGHLPAGTEWRDIEMKFDKPIEEEDGEWSLSSVLVDKNFST